MPKAREVVALLMLTATTGCTGGSEILSPPP
jgi:hypothetical protein